MPGPASRSSRRTAQGLDYWPAFVDALSTLLLAIIFVLSIFVLSQFLLGQEIAGRDTALQRLNRQISELTELLALERTSRRAAEDNLAAASATLSMMQGEQARLSGQMAVQLQERGKAAELSGALDTQKEISARALSQVEALNQQMAALRQQLAALQSALEASEGKDKEAQLRIADLGARLNLALAQRVQELQRYRSDFFGRLREIVGSRSDIRTVGDRFVFQSEVFFDVGQAQVKPEGVAELEKLVTAIRNLEREIPPDIPWVLRVDGHTDVRPVSGVTFRSNWDLSAARAIAVVQTLIAKGIAPQRLIAAGFGEFQPLELGDSEEAYRRNRRIEFKLTER